MEACRDQAPWLFKSKSNNSPPHLNSYLSVQLQSNRPFYLNQSPKLAGIIFQVKRSSVQKYISMAPAHANITDPDVSVMSTAQLDLGLHVHADDMDSST